MLKSFNSDVLIFEEIKLLRKKFYVLLSPAFVRHSGAVVAMAFELLSVEEVLVARFTCVELAGLLVDAKHVFFQIIAGGEGFGANVASMVSLVEMNAEDVTSDS